MLRNLGKYEKQNIYSKGRDITNIHSKTHIYKIIRIEHRIRKMELDVETRIDDICNVLINT